jgi:purine catabolism regulator
MTATPTLRELASSRGTARGWGSAVAASEPGMRALAPRITVAGALELPELRRGVPEVLAGAASLDRAIRWVHAGEVPNIASLLRGGELLLTTGMGMGSRAVEHRRFIAELASKNAAGLVIELGVRFSGRLPRALVVAAEEFELPLVELHAEVQFVAVTEAIHTEIVNHHYTLLCRADALQERFTGVMLQGGGVRSVLSLLAEAIGNPVFLESDDGRLLAHAAPGDEDHDPMRAWRQARRGAPSVGATAEIPSDAGRGGRLVALPLEAPLDAFANLALERAAGIVALAFLRAHQEDELLAFSRGDLLNKLANGRIDPAVAEARAQDAGFCDRGIASLLPIAARLVLPVSPSRPAAWAAAIRDVGDRLATLGLPSILGIDPDGGGLLIILGVRAAEDRKALAAAAATIVREVTRRRSDADAVVAVGPMSDWATVGNGLRDAIESCAVGDGLPSELWLDATAMPLDRLLWRLRDDKDLQRYVDGMLGRLVAHDRRRKHGLLPTLEALCEQGGRKAKAARSLHLNRQALYDRIARIEHVLGADLSDARTLLALHVALRARRQLAALRSESGDGGLSSSRSESAGP